MIALYDPYTDKDIVQCLPTCDRQHRASFFGCYYWCPDIQHECVNPLYTIRCEENYKPDIICGKCCDLGRSRPLKHKGSFKPCDHGTKVLWVAPCGHTFKTRWFCLTCKIEYTCQTHDDNYFDHLC
jgi:hypothetical protein